MLLSLHIVWTMISYIYGAAIESVQDSADLTTAELRERGNNVLVGACLAKYSLDIGFGNGSMTLDLEEVGEVPYLELELGGQKITCDLSEDEAVVRYVDAANGAEALVISRTYGRMLLRRMVLRFQYEDRTYVLEPPRNTFLRCTDEEGDEPLDDVLIFGSIHYLYEFGEDYADPTSEDMDTTTKGGPVDPPEPPILMIIIIVACSLILLALVAICFCRCCCRSAPSYKSM